MKARVLIAEDHVLVAQAFRNLLEPAFEVCGIAADGRALMAMAAELKPDIVLADVSMPLLNGLEAGKAIRDQQPSIKLVFLTMDQDPDLAAAAFRIGARGYLLKHSGTDELARCLASVASGERYLTPLIAGGDISDLLLATDDRQDLESLSSREREVLQLLAEGRSMIEAAGILGITPRTVAFHKYRLMDRLNLKSNADLVQFAVRRKVVNG
jgi:DNA-binding NarL/FixJ family response regulator